MSNFKSGAGNLDFGGGDEDDEKDEHADETTEGHDEASEESKSAPTDQLSSASPQEVSSDTEQSSDRAAAQPSSQGDANAGAYPYFIRRNNVGDERDTRLEIHVRDKVTEQEPKFRNELAEQLGANEVSKTDAREFALLAAFQYPNRVAELMQEEGFGALD